MALLGKAGHHDVLGRILDVGLLGDLHSSGRLHDALRMGHTGTHFQQDRGVKLLGDLVGQLGKGQSLRRVRRLQHGQLSGLGIIAGILLVLRAVHTRVIGNADNHAGVDTGVGDGEQWVGRNVQAHVLHAAEAPLAAHGRAESGLNGDLFIGRPLGVDLRVLGGALGDLRAGRTGITGYKSASGLI